MTLSEIFDTLQDKDITFSDGKEKIQLNLMSKGEFVETVTMLMKHTSTGKQFESIEEMHEYYGINS